MTGPLYVLIGGGVLFVLWILAINVRDALLLNRVVDRHRIGNEEPH
jgi:hypothetical protein